MIVLRASAKRGDPRTAAFIMTSNVDPTASEYGGNLNMDGSVDID
jgi:hypothetical protein